MNPSLPLYGFDDGGGGVVVVVGAVVVVGTVVVVGAVVGGGAVVVGVVWQELPGHGCFPCPNPITLPMSRLPVLARLDRKERGVINKKTQTRFFCRSLLAGW